jgi:hypothetical protein
MWEFGDGYRHHSANIATEVSPERIGPFSGPTSILGGSMEPQVLIQAVAQHDGVHADAYQQRRSTAAGGDLAAYLAHRHTTATLRDLAAPFGFNHPATVNNLIRRAEKHLAQPRHGRAPAARTVETITKTENSV